jgi:HlyD family secretion protein
MSKKRLIPLVLLLVVIGGGAWGWYQWRGQEDGRLTLYGNVDIRLVDVSFRVEGRLSEMLVEEGDRVEKGQTLARVDDVYLKDQLALAQARFDAQRAVVDRLTAGSRKEEIAQARALVAERKATVENSQTTYQRLADLKERNVASQQRKDDAEAALKEAKAKLKQARDSLDLVIAGPRAEDIRAAIAQLDGEQATLALAKRRLADAELTSPATGTIQTRVREPGAMMSPGAVVYTIALASPVWVRAYVSETDLGRAVPGAHVAIHTDSAPGKAYKGQIGFVSPVAEFTPKTVETPSLRTSLVYRLRIVVDNPDDGLRQGMPVTVTFPSEAPAPAS